MADIVDPASRLDALLKTQESRFAASFRLMVANIRNDMDLTEIANFLERGQLEDALAVALRRVPNLGTMYMNSFLAAADDTASFLNKNLTQIVIDFDQTNPFAVEIARQNRLRLVREFTQKQVEATREALLEGIQTGANPRVQARAFRDSIGLTKNQVRAVNNYRRMLEEGDRAVFDRLLRDKRFDSTVRNALSSGKPLTRTQINRMVDRYRERYIKYRSEVIGRTEALKSVHQGKHAMYLQAIENGDLDPSTLENEWQTSLRENVRDSHRDMHGQKRPFGEMFVSGAGNLAPHPGAFNVAEEDIQCVCTLSTRITDATTTPQEAPEITTEEWQRSLSDDEKKAIKSWADFGWTDIKRYQETGVARVPSVVDRTRDLQSAVNRAPAWKGSAWRGLSLEPEVLESLKSDLKLSSFQSFSDQRDIGLKFALKRLRRDEVPALMEFRMKNGAKISSIATGEGEVLPRLGSSWTFQGFSEEVAPSGTSFTRLIYEEQ